VKGLTKLKFLIALIPVGIFVSIPYALQIRKMLKMPNPEMYE
jgi:hypothetical protein